MIRIGSVKREWPSVPVLLSLSVFAFRIRYRYSDLFSKGFSWSLSLSFCLPLGFPMPLLWNPLSVFWTFSYLNFLLSEPLFSEPSDLISSGSSKIYDFDELMNWEIYDFDELMNGEIYDFDELLIWQLYGLETFHLVNFQNLDSCYNKNMF